MHSKKSTPKKVNDLNKKNSRSNLMAYSVLIVIALIIGAGLMVYNADDLYIGSHTNLTLLTNVNFEQGGEESLIITAVDDDGDPIAKQEVVIKLETEDETIELFEGKTDSKGVLSPDIDLPDDVNGTAKLIVELENGDKIVQEVIIHEQEELEGINNKEVKILISTDKPLYQPLQTVNIRVLAIYGQDQGVYEGPVTIDVDDPDGNKILREELETSEYGIVGTDYTISDQLPEGNYKILAKIGNKEAKKSVTIQRYVLPKFRITFEGLKSWYTVDEHITGTARCMYIFGKPVKGTIAFTVRTYYSSVYEVIHSETGQLDEYGTFDFDIDPVEYAVGLPNNKDSGFVELNATITDYADHSETKLQMVTIAREPIMISAITDTNIQGATSNYYVLAQAPDGAPVEGAEVEITLDDNTDFIKKSSDNELITTDSKGLYEFRYEYVGQKKMDVKVTKGEMEAERTFELVEKPGIKLVSANLFNAVGEEVEFDVFYTGTSYTNWVYYNVINQGFSVTTGAFQLGRGSGVREGTFSLPLTPEMVGTSYVRVYKIEKDEDVVMDFLTLAVEPTAGLEVTIEKDDDIYNPNQTAKIKFKVTEDNVGVVSALGVGVVDQAIFELSSRYGGFQDIFFELEETAMEPKYQILDYLYSSGGSIGLPEDNVVDLHDYEAVKTSGVYYTQVNIQSNWNDQLGEAEDVKADYVNTYWAILIIAGTAALLAGVVIGIKYKPALAVVVFIIMVVAIILGGLLFSGSSFYTKVEKSSELAEGGDMDKDDDNDGGAAPAGGGAQDFDGDEGGWREEVDDGTDWKNADGGEPAPGPAPSLGPEGEADGDGDFIPSGNGSAPGSEHAVGHTREYFPETWYWNPVLITDENGEVELELVTPDSITTWEITGTANTQDGKIGMNNLNLTVFQRFFIEPDLPVSVIRNDTFQLKIMVYNYDDVDHDVWVYLYEDEWFDILTESPQKVAVQADNVSKVTFTIQALEVGEHDLSISGYQTDDNLWDDVIKPLRVDPDGKLVDETINGKLTDVQTAEVDLELSSDRVPNSENAYVKLQGGMEAVILDGAESFIHFVSGCGEQSMSTLNIDILAFDVVQNLGTATEEKMFEYEGIVTQGITHELQYLMDAQNGEGRGIVWFPSDDDVHPWLTSWGLITFQDAVTAGFNIDQAIITDMQTWLISQQNTDGSFEFPERGLYEFTNPILKSKEFSASAYITRSLLYSGYSSTSTEIVDAVTYLEDNVDDHWDDPLTLALTLLVLEQANGDTQTRSDVADRIDELKIEDALNGTVYWGSGTSMITDSDIMWEGGWGQTGANYHSIETTGYCLMALAEHGSHQNTVGKAVKYLIENRKALGGWFATQDTIVAFQALRAGGQNNIDELTVTVFADNVEVSSTTFTDYNIDLTYLIDLRPYLKESTKIKLESTGVGSVMYQVYCGEYIPWDIIGVDEPPELLLDISYDSTTIKVDDKLEATLSLKYVGSASHIKMILIDLRAPVGFSFVEDDLVDMVDNDEISSYEINDRQAYIYIEDLQYDTNYTLVYHLLANDPIKGTIQGINAFDMYNTDLNAEVEPVEVESQL